MMFCKDCGHIFTEAEIVQEFVNIVHDEYDIIDTCPYCGSEDIACGNEDRF